MSVSFNTYPYFEEVNEGILKLFPKVQRGERFRVLDVGCGRGALGSAIKVLGYECWGIEKHPEAVQKALERLDRVIEADLTEVDSISSQIPLKSFDYLVFSDVLEHLNAPQVVLKEYLRFLKPGGLVFISVPNVAVWENRIRLLFGCFNYQDYGALDRTHIRFFTFRSAIDLVRAAELKIIRIDWTPYFARAFLPWIKSYLKKKEKHNAGVISQSRFFRYYMRFIYPIEYLLAGLWKSLFAFRIIICAQKYNE